MKSFIEREDKWEVGDGFRLPPDVVGDATTVDRDTVELVSEYYDTDDRDLQSHGVSLRRRDGDTDVGWQIKVNAPESRLELHAALSDTPPDELVAVLTGIRLGKPLSPVATIRTHRERYRVTDEDRRLLRVELVDDRVHASRDGDELSWRELELEHGPAAGRLPRRVARSLAKAGARPASYPSKLHRVLPAPAPSPFVPPPAKQALTDYLRDQIEKVFAGDLGLRRGQDPIHDTRVAIRRLRSTLRVFARFFDDDTATRLDAELKWFAGLLGEVRDAQLQRRRFNDVLDGWSRELVLGPVRARVDGDLRGAEVRARAAVTEAMDSARHLKLLGVLQQWTRDVPLVEAPTRKTLKKATRKARRKADRRLIKGLCTGGGARLHRARKAAKRARYAAELRSALPECRTRKGKHYKHIQRVLGDFQDSVVAADTLYRLGMSAGTTAGENGFTFGLLYSRERCVQQEIRGRAANLIG